MTSILDETLYVEMGSKIMNMSQTKVKHRRQKPQTIFNDSIKYRYTFLDIKIHDSTLKNVL